MNNPLLFGISVGLSFCAWGYVCAAYVWPYLRARSLVEASSPILVLHLFRFVGASFLIVGVAAPGLPAAFAAPAAYGDLVSVMLAWLALAARRVALFKPCLWLFNLWGTADLLLAFYQGLVGARIDAGALGATFYVPTVFVPLLLCTHVMVFLLLARRS